jgi:CubicO group peptidase (beta-lactamase class C family)
MTPMNRFFAPSLAVVLIASSAFADRDTDLKAIASAGDIPGLSVTRISRGRIAWSKQLGRREAMDLSPGAATVDKFTAFEGASLGKPLVALAALWLVDRDQLDLDASAETIVPYTALANPRKSAITPRMLLSHTSGLSFGQPYMEAAPGARFRYSTEGFRYLQRIVEKQLGERLELWAQRTLFGPLRMNRTSFTYSERFAINRARGRNWLMVGQEYMTNAEGTGAFDLITTSEDYARLWVGVLQGKILSKKAVAMMFEPQKEIKSRFDDVAIPKTEKIELSVGLGVLLQKQKGRWVGFQWGDNGGSTSFLLVDPAVKDAVVYFSNAEDGLHAGQAIVKAAGLHDEAITWVGYEQYTTKPRQVWKEITLSLDKNSEDGIKKYKRLLDEDKATVLPISRNIGYYNRFKGRIKESEPFFRNAILVDSSDPDLFQGWADALLAEDKIEDAAAAQEKALKLDAGRKKDLILPEWVRQVKQDLSQPLPIDLAALGAVPGIYEAISVELVQENQLFVTRGGARSRLILTSSGDYLAENLTARYRFMTGKVTVQEPGKPLKEYTKARP